MSIISELFWLNCVPIYYNASLIYESCDFMFEDFMCDFMFDVAY